MSRVEQLLVDSVARLPFRVQTKLLSGFLAIVVLHFMAAGKTTGVNRKRKIIQCAAGAHRLQSITKIELADMQAQKPSAGW